MNISISPVNMSNKHNVNTLKRQNTVQFTGALGDKFVREIETVVTPDIMKELKGTFGLKTEKVEDVIGSFVEAMRDMINKRKLLSVELNSAKAKIAKFPKQKDDAVRARESELINSWTKTIQAKNEEVSAAKAETKEAKAALEKYKPVVAVKPVEEMVSIMPDKALEILNEMVEHKAAANKSMFEFLMTGKGQEEALAQIERNNMLKKASEDGIFNIQSISEEYAKIRKDHSIYTAVSDQYFTTNLIERALMSDTKGEYLSSYAIKEQVKKNAMAILTPMADERYSNTNLEYVERELDNAIERAKKFHEGFKIGLERVKKDYSKEKDFEMIINRIDNDVDKSTVTIKYTPTYGGDSKQPLSFDFDFAQIANRGNSSY